MYHRCLPKQRMFLKSHLLIAARELEQRYDGVKFLTIVQNPMERFYSVINFIKVFSVDGPTSKGLNVVSITWRVARDWAIESQICYCEEEMNFYNQSEETLETNLAYLLILT